MLDGRYHVCSTPQPLDKQTPSCNPPPAPPVPANTAQPSPSLPQLNTTRPAPSSIHVHLIPVVHQTTAHRPTQTSRSVFIRLSLYIPLPPLPHLPATTYSLPLIQSSLPRVSSLHRRLRSCIRPPPQLDMHSLSLHDCQTLAVQPPDEKAEEDGDEEER